MTIPPPPPLKKKIPFTVHCRDCKHEWAPFFLPLTMDKMGLALMRSAGKACPKCVGPNVFVGPVETARDAGLKAAARSNG